MTILLPSKYQEFIHLSRYAKWLPEKKRRETWEETVDRYFNFFKKRINLKEMKKIRNAVLKLEVMPSMRCLMTAGEALENDNICGYNCSYIAITNPRCFSEILYILMNGTGVGFSVESENVKKLPKIKKTTTEKLDIIVEDSKIGWAKALDELICNLFNGIKPGLIDISKIRPKGSRLKTFGGRASGPDVLLELFDFITNIFKNCDDYITPLNCHDILCKIAQAIVVGGVRRSALISLSDLDDIEMRDCKKGKWWEKNPQRALANNSVCYNELPTRDIFFTEWHSLIESRSGERGFFNRKAINKSIVKNGKRDFSHNFGTNPCSEIILRNEQFCNLTEIILKKDDNLKNILKKAEYAAILGTLQSTLTSFKYINNNWKTNCEDERLLGVSLTGIMDCKLVNTNNTLLPYVLSQIKDKIIETNLKYSKILKISPSKATTCIKPSGNVSQLCNVSSGIHARYAKYYYRTVRNSNMDPLCKFMKEKNFVWETDLTNPDNTVFYFPIKAPKTAIFTDDLSAIDQVKKVMDFQLYYTEHKVSTTINVRDNEWDELGEFVYKNIEYLSGIAFLPLDDHSYKQAPYQKCTKKQYKNLKARTPNNINWCDLQKYEENDNTTCENELVCTGNKCEL